MWRAAPWCSHTSRTRALLEVMVRSESPLYTVNKQSTLDRDPAPACSSISDRFIISYHSFNCGCPEFCEKPHDHCYRSSRVGYYHLCIRAGQLGPDQIRSRCRFLKWSHSFSHKTQTFMHTNNHAHSTHSTHTRTHSLNDLTSWLTSISSTLESWEAFKQPLKITLPSCGWSR